MHLDAESILVRQLRTRMRQRNETQDDLARVLGITRVAVNGRFNNRTKWSLADLDRLATYYQVRAADLLDPDRDDTSSDPITGTLRGESDAA